MSFAFYNVGFHRYADGSWACAKGDVENNSHKDYNTAIFRLVLFDGNNHIIWSGNFRLNGFRRGRTKSFELFLEGADLTEVTAVKKFNLFFENGY